MRAQCPASAWKLLLLASILTWSACTGDTGDDGSSCTVERARDGGARVIRCDDGTETAVPSGVEGTSCSVEANSDGSKTIRCTDGTNVVVENGKTGDAGARGEPGERGVPGADGEQGDRGAPGVDGIDGQPGSDGQNGADGSSQIVVGAGLTLEILGVTIPGDARPLVQVRLRDAQGRALDRTGGYTPGAVSVSFVLAYLPADGEPYVPYDVTQVAGVSIGSVPPVLSAADQPRTDTNGAWRTIDPLQGSYEYRFERALPSGYDVTKTHTLAAFAVRSVDTSRYVANALFHFRPDGNASTASRDVVSTGACNGCHATLSAHDDSVREVGACVMCHVSGMADPESGNSLDFRRMIHTLHRGGTLPTQSFAMVGSGGVSHDYTSVRFPRPTESCTTCHTGAAHSARFQTTFSRDVCGSCHDDIFFGALADLPLGKKPHSGNPQTSDSFCSLCHEAGAPAYPSGLLTAIDQVHRPLRGYAVQDPSNTSVKIAPPVLTGGIVGVSGTSSGADFPVITFDAAIDGVPVAAIGQLDRVRFTFAGPTTDYVYYAQYTAHGSGATGAIAATGNPGEFTWTSARTLQEISDAPTLASPARPAIPLVGTWAVGMEARVTRNVVKPDTSVVNNVTFSMHNDVRYFAITDSVPVPRREVVNVAQCNGCHEDLAAHGGSRNDPEYCVLCHNANHDSSNVPLPAAGGSRLTSSVRASHMVHRIHTGVDGAQPFQIGNDDFSGVRFPGDRRNCEHCHVAGSYALPLASGLLPSFAQSIDDTGARQSGTDTYTGAMSAACTGCHDSASAVAHTQTMSVVSSSDPTSIGEACATCHAAGRVFGLDVVHARD